MTDRLRGLSLRVAVLVAAVVAAVCVPGGAALASWTVTGTGQAVAAAASLGAPTAPQVKQSGGSAVVSWGAPTGSGGAAADGYVVRRYPGVLGPVGPATVVCQTGPATRTCTDPAPPAAGSSYVVSARLSGWETAASWVAHTPDTTAPTTTATPPAANGRGWVTTTPVTVTLTATDGPAGAASGVASVSYRVDGGLVTTQAGATAAVPIAQQGTVQLDYWATDAVGNVEATRSLQLHVDSVAPTTPANLRISSDTGASGTDFVTSATQQTVTGTAEPGSTVELSYRGSVVGTATTAADGTFRVGPQPVVAGSFPMSVRSIDPAGNGSGSATFTLVVDTTAPAPAITFPLDAGSYTSSTWAKGCAATGLCGTASDAGSGVNAVLYELRDVTAGTCWNGSSFGAAACSTLRTATGTSPWAVPVAYASLPRSTNLQLSVYVDDLAGNRSALLKRTFQVK